MSDLEPSPEQLRAIPLDTLRCFTMAHSERISLQEIAERSGVGRTTLHNFIYRNTTPHPRVRRLLALYYTREAGAVGADGCEMLLSALPANRRADAVTELLAFLQNLHIKYSEGGNDDEAYRKSGPSPMQ